MKNKILLGLSFLFIVSLSIFIFNTIYTDTLPKIVEEINNGAIGAIITAVVTVLLLSSQTTSEEVKERNVKVFEKKSEVFNSFIEKLWDIWEDRSVSLEEINDLLKHVSKDIIPYAKPASSEAILKELNKIADFANPDKSDSANNETTQQIQKSVFAIINILSKEMGLGGEIIPQISQQLNSLENKVLPALNRKNSLSILNRSIECLNLKQPLYWDNDNYGSVLWSELENRMWLRVGDASKSKPTYITFWSNYKNSQYHDYRHVQSGKDRDWMKGRKSLDDFDFSVIRDGKQISTEKIKTLADEIITFYQEWNIDGKTISQIIENE